MAGERDYYDLLGVIPTAEDIVVRAAYRALAERYQSDNWHGSTEDAAHRTAELNAAYAILSDPATRKSYDESRDAANAKSTLEGSDDEASSAFEAAAQAQEADWRFALEFVPELDERYQSLRLTSGRLAFAFREHMLRKKEFNRCAEVAEQLEREFLGTYFGDDPVILAYARSLIAAGNRAAARDLNRAVSVLGNGVPPLAIIVRLCYRSLPDGSRAAIRQFLQTNEGHLRDLSLRDSQIEHLVSGLGGVVEGLQGMRREWFKVKLFGNTFSFETEHGLKVFIRDKLCPTLTRLTSEQQ